MASESKKKLPLYLDVDQFRIPGMFSVEKFKSALQYKPQPDDVFIVTYPKCGTTWIQNIVSCIFKKGETFSSLKEFHDQTPFLDMTGAEILENLTRPYAIKTHLPFHLVPYSPDAKYIVVARNPKDCCISFYHHTVRFAPYNYEDGTFDDYFELFVDGAVDYGDYFDHLLSWYEHRNDENVFFITYEELKENIGNSILRISEFIRKDYKDMLVANPNILESIIKHTSFDFMKKTIGEMIENVSAPPKTSVEKVSVSSELKQSDAKSETVNDYPGIKRSLAHPQLVRKGIIGDWRNHLSEDQSARLDAKFRERTEGTDIPKLWRKHM